eukprot:m51a1_g13394 hypothetical protein (245) ;mRNA; f:353-1259
MTLASKSAEAAKSRDASARTLVQANSALLVWACAVYAALAASGYTPLARPLQFLLRFVLCCAPAVALHSFAISKHALRFKTPLLQFAVASVVWFASGCVCFYLVAFLFGAPLFERFEATFLWASLMSSVSFLPYGCILAHTTVPPSAFARAMWIIGSPAAGACLGAWVSAFVIPLDWDRPWQAWPIPCTVGALVGCFAGSLVCTARELLRRNQPASSGEEPAASGSPKVPTQAQAAAALAKRRK